MIPKTGRSASRFHSTQGVVSGRSHPCDLGRICLPSVHSATLRDTPRPGRPLRSRPWRHLPDKRLGEGLKVVPVEQDLIGKRTGRNNCRKSDCEPLPCLWAGSRSRPRDSAGRHAPRAGARYSPAISARYPHSVSAAALEGLTQTALPSCAMASSRLPLHSTSSGGMNADCVSGGPGSNGTA